MWLKMHASLRTLGVVILANMLMIVIYFRTLHVPQSNLSRVRLDKVEEKIEDL